MAGKRKHAELLNISKTVRFTREQINDVKQAAARKGVSAVEYVRLTAVAEARYSNALELARADAALAADDGLDEP